MKSELDELIEYYEMERDHLLNELKECLGGLELDYGTAELHQNALYKVNRQLDTLYCLRDPLYPEKRNLQMSRSMFEKMKQRSGEMTNGYCEKKILEIDQKLDEINKQETQPILERQDLDDLIYDIVENKISGFRLYLKRKYDVYFELSRKHNDQLLLYFPANDEVSTWENELKRMGFTFNESKNSLEYLYDLKSFRNAAFLKTFIARVIFDVFGIPYVDIKTSIKIQTHIE